MRKLVLAASLFAALATYAQESFLNNYLVNNSDLFGTARYVGMGGALGALGADISAIGSNPAALGMFRRTTASITFGAMSQIDKNTDGEKTVRASLDQLGLTISIPFDGSGIKYLNLGLNYQKKVHFGHSFLADCYNTGGSSLLNNLMETYEAFRPAQGGGDPNVTPLVNLAGYAGLLRVDGDGQVYGFDNPDASRFNIDNHRFKRIMTGHTQSYDFNLSANVKDRVFLGLTVGVDRLKYESHGTYDEAVSEVADPTHYHDFSLNNWQQISGTGFNLKFGAIVRPMENSPFRVGLAIETPTWYRLDYVGEAEFMTRYQLNGDRNSNPFSQEWAATDFNNKDSYPESTDINALTYNLASPWRVRLSLGYTIGSWLAVGAEYEYADYGATSMGYPTADNYYDDYYDGWWESSTKDEAMNSQTSRTHQGVNAFKFGAEAKPFKGFAVRAGYNYYSSSSRKEGRLDNTTNSYSSLFNTNTDYMKLDDVNILTFGLGYSASHFYADFAYKYRMQGADFYPYSDAYVVQEPIRLNLDRHQVFITLGYKF